MRPFKKAFSLIMAFVMVLSCLCIGASAEGEDFKLSISKIQKYDEATHTIVEGDITEAKAGDVVVVTFSIENQSSSSIRVGAYTAYMEYDADLLTPYIDGSDVDWDGFFYENSYLDLSSSAFTVGNPAVGEIIMAGSTASGVPVKAGQATDIGQIAFQINTDAESTSAQFAFDTAKRNQIADTQENKKTIDATAVTLLKINGGAPTLGTVTLDKNSAEVDGTNADTVKATAVSTKGIDLTNNVAWSIAPAGQGVTVDADGTVTVDAKAVAGTYRVTAAADGTNVLGSSDSAAFTVSRRAPILTDILLDKKLVTVDGINDQTITVEMLDQYGSPMDSAISVSPSEGISVSGKTIIVGKDAAEGTYTARIAGKAATFYVLHSAESKDLKLSISEIQKYDEVTHSIIPGAVTAAAAGDVVVITFSIENQSPSIIRVGAYEVYMEYDADLLTPYIDVTDEIGDGPFYDGISSDLSGSSFTVGNPDAGDIIMAGSTPSGVIIRAGKTANIGQIAFKINDDAESTSTQFAFDFTEENLIADTNEQKKTVDATGITSLDILGLDRKLDALSLNQTSVLADSVHTVSLRATALSCTGSDLSNDVQWSISPANEEVTISDTGFITVNGKAPAGVYTVTATSDGSNVYGPAVTAELLVTRNASVLTEIKLDKTEVTLDGENDQVIHVELIDQYDSQMDASISVTPSVGITVSGQSIIIDKNAAGGTYTVTVGDKQSSFVVIIPKVLVSISVMTPPTKLTYLEGKDDLDLSGGVLELSYNYGPTSEIPLSEAKVFGFDNTVVGPQTLTVSYEGKTCTFGVTIKAKTLTSISVKTPPAKLVYLEGKDTLDLAGGVLNLFYDNGTFSEVPLSEAAVSGFNNTVVGAQTLMVTYKDKHCTFGITIQPKSLTSISIKALPKKLAYFECSGALDLFGGVLTLSYDNDTSAELPLSDAAVSVSGFDNTTVGPQTLTVSYKDKMCTFEVEILPAYELTANATTGTYQLTTYANPQEATLVIAYYGKSGQLISSTHTEVKLQVGQTISGTYDTSIPCNMMLLSTVPAPLCKAVTPLP